MSEALLDFIEKVVRILYKDNTGHVIMCNMLRALQN